MFLAKVSSNTYSLSKLSEKTILISPSAYSYMYINADNNLCIVIGDSNITLESVEALGRKWSAPFNENDLTDIYHASVG